MTFTRAAVTLLAVTSCCAALKVIDMSYNLNAKSIAWPIFPPFSFTILNRGLTKQGFWFEINQFETPEHKGTHLDSPCHFNEYGWRVHQIPPSNLVGPAVVIDIRDKVTNDHDYLFSINDVKEWESNHGRLPDNCIIMMNSGWSRRYPDARKVFNSNDTRDPAGFHFPGIDPDLVVWLASYRDVIAMAVDTPSVDRGQAPNFPTHQMLGRYSILGVENVRNMGRLPPTGATVVLGVIKLQDGSGGPVRVLALIDESCECAKKLTKTADASPQRIISRRPPPPMYGAAPSYGYFPWRQPDK